MPKNLGKRFGNITMGQVFAVILFGFISIQGLAKIFSKWIPAMDLRFGIYFQLLSVGFIIYLMFTFIVTKQAMLEKKHLFVFLIMIALSIGIFFYLPKFFPEIFTFTTGNEQIQSFAGQVQSFIGGN